MKTKASPRSFLETPKQRWKSLSCIVSLFTFLLGILTLVSLFYFFSPTIAVSPAEQLHILDPFSVTFEISNQGIRKVYNVKIACHIDELRTPRETTIISSGETLEGDDILDEDEVVPILKSGKTISARCRSFYANVLPLKANITLSISYRPSFWLWRSTEPFKFILKRTADGKLIWLPQQNLPRREGK